MNIMKKTLDSIVANRLSWAAQTFKLLPRGHMGGKKGASPKHALHLLLESIHAAWNEKKTAILLLWMSLVPLTTFHNHAFSITFAKRKLV